MRIKRNRAISGLSAFVFILILGIFTSSQLDDTYYMDSQWTSADSYLIYDYLSNIDDCLSEGIIRFNCFRICLEIPLVRY